MLKIIMVNEEPQTAAAVVAKGQLQIQLAATVSE